MNPIVSVDWLNEQLHDPNLIILDASLKAIASNRQTLHPNIQIIGARFFDFKKVFSDQASEIPNMLPSPENFTAECQKLGINQESKIVVYDNLGIYSSPRAWWMFKAMGHEQIAVLDGGLPAWMAKNFAHEEIQQREYPKGNFQANYQANLVWSAQEVLQNLDNPSATIIDARSEGRFNGTSPEPREGLKSGRIPKSKSLPYQQVLKDGHFLPKAELQDVFEQLKLKNQPLVFTCGSGLTACIISLASQLVQDYPTAVYDGSWSEWGMFDASLIEV